MSAPATTARRTALLAVIATLGLAGCAGEDPQAGDQGSAEGGAPAPAQQPQGGAGGAGGAPEAQPRQGAQSCDRVAVPGHEGVAIRVQGADCEKAARVIGAAVGKGRQAYQAAGFSCAPSEAGGGDTNYTCTRQGARITFRYGAA